MSITLDDLILSRKLKYILNPTKLRQFNVLAGATRTSKTVVMLMALRELMKFHDSDAILGLASITKGIRDIIDNLFSITKLFDDCEYVPANNHGGARIQVKTRSGVRNMHITDYSTATSHTKKLLGTSIRIIGVDELSACHLNFLTETIERTISNDGFMIAATNGDAPDNPMYEMLIYKCKTDTPFESHIPTTELHKFVGVFENSQYIHFDLPNDARHMNENQYNALLKLYAPGTVRYQNKILGVPAAIGETPFAPYLIEGKTIKPPLSENDRRIHIAKYSAGLDTSYSTQSSDKIVCLLAGWTVGGTIHVIDALELNNQGRDENRYLVSDVAKHVVNFLYKYGNKQRGVFVDSADQSMKNELYIKHREVRPENSWKQWSIPDRVTYIENLLATGRLIINENLKNMIKELRSIVMDEKKPGYPVDSKLIGLHYFDALCYAIAPFIDELEKNSIGVRYVEV